MGVSGKNEEIYQENREKTAKKSNFRCKCRWLCANAV